MDKTGADTGVMGSCGENSDGSSTIGLVETSMNFTVLTSLLDNTTGSFSFEDEDSMAEIE